MRSSVLYNTFFLLFSFCFPLVYSWTSCTSSDDCSYYGCLDYTAEAGCNKVGGEFWVWVDYRKITLERTTWNNQYLATGSCLRIPSTGGSGNYCGCAGTCIPGFYRVDCGCVRCASACSGGLYESVPCTSNSNRQCQECSSCPAGKYLTATCNATTNNICVDCPINTYCPSGTTSAIYCPAGLISSPKSQLLSDCRCAVGTYQASVSPILCKNCTECPSTTYQNKSCDEFSDSVCIPCPGMPPCPGGTYEVGCINAIDKVCKVCPANSYCLGGQAKPISCVNGTFSPVGASEDNHCCPSNSYTNVSNRLSQCKKCTICTYLEYQVSPCLIDADTVCSLCKACNSDEYIVKSCTATLDPVCGKCSKCLNTYQISPCNITHDTVCSSCIICMKGYYLPDYTKIFTCTNNSIEHCLPCPAGHYCPYANTSSVPILCPSFTNSSLGASSVYQCKVQSGFYGTVKGPINICPSNHFCPSNATAPVKCPLNTRSNSGSTSHDNCTANAGYYGKYGTLCLAGYYCPEASLLPFKCPHYSTSLPGAIHVENCSALSSFMCV